MISKVASSENDGKNLSSKILIQTLNFVPVLHPLKELLKRRPANTANRITRSQIIYEINHIRPAGDK